MIQETNMETVEVSNVPLSDNCPRLAVDIPEDSGLTLPTWSNCIFSRNDDDFLGVSEVFSGDLPSFEEISSGSSNSSLSSASFSSMFNSLSPPSFLPSGNPPLSETELGQIGSSTDSCYKIEVSTPCVGNVMVKNQQTNDMTELLDCPAATPNELLFQSHSSLFTTFDHDLISCQDLSECCMSQQHENDLLQVHSNPGCDLEPISLPDVFPSLVCEDDHQNSGVWKLLVPSGSSVPFTPQDLPEISEDHSESLPQIFAQWLKNNADCFSIADLKKIKLKTSTIENATQNLGGGKKGMVYLLKLILAWIQNHHLRHQHIDNCIVDEADTNLDSRLMNGFPCSTSNIDKTIAEGDKFIEDAYKEDREFLDSLLNRNQYLGNAILQSEERANCFDTFNSVETQHMHQTNLCQDDISQTASPSYDIHIPSQPIDPVKSGKLLHSSRDTSSFDIRQTSLADMNSTLHLDHITSTSNNPQPWWRMTEDRSWHSSMVHLNSQGTSPVIRDRHLHCFSGTKVLAEKRPCMVVGDSLNIRCSTPAATTRAARKSRMARQRWSAHHTRMWQSAVPSQLSDAIQGYGSAFQNTMFKSQSHHRMEAQTGTQQSRKSERKLRLLLQKELKQSDVGNFGRIILPKKEAEINLPYLPLRDGINLAMEDWSSSKIWNMRYRFWPNNKSRMYLLENTGDFVKCHHLKEGDHMILYDDTCGNYMIRGLKISQSKTSNMSTEEIKPGSCNANASGHATRIGFVRDH